VLACSALKESYRATLAAGMPEGTLRFVLLELSKQEIAQRMAERHHEFMNPALLDSQFATLETPKYALQIVNDRTPEEVVQEILSRIRTESKVQS
jgi:gluconokinase